jgi:hypothetical protein
MNFPESLKLSGKFIYLFTRRVIDVTALIFFKCSHEINAQ